MNDGLSHRLLAPGIHEQLLIGSNCFFLQLRTRLLILHDCSNVNLGVLLLKVGLPKREEASKLTQVVASYSFHSVNVAVLETVLRNLK